MIRTGLDKLDILLNGGIKKGSIVDFRGDTGTGKSLAALSIIKSNIDKNIIYINVNKKYSKNFLYKIGIDPSKVIIIDTNCSEDIFNILLRILPEKKADIIIFDDISQLKSKFEDKNISDIIKEYKERFWWCVSKYRCVSIFINQNRYILGEEFYIAENLLNKNANYVFYFNVKQLIRYRHEYIGQIMNIRVDKPISNYGEVNIRSFYNKGVDEVLELIDVALNLNIINKKGNWMQYNGVTMGNGLYNSSLFLKRNKNILEEINIKINEYIGKLNAKLFY